MNEDKNREAITTFYNAFRNKDSKTMASCYHPDATFCDPVFSDLSYDELTAMWAMLCERGENLTIRFEEPFRRDEQYIVAWTADYEFGTKKRRVLNQITANIVCVDGKIFRHRDEFSFFRWSVQAFGPVAFLTGWTPFFKNKVQAGAMKSLAKYMKTKH